MDANFDDLELLERLESGAVSDVFRARLAGDSALEKIVAVKRLFPELVELPDFEKRFFRDCTAIVQMRHPNILEVFKYGRVGQHLYIVMEFISGKSLSAFIERGATLGIAIPIEITCYIISEICKGLEFANSFGSGFEAAHGGLTPDTIVLGYQGEVKIVDFGIASAIGAENFFQIRQREDSLAYCSPEQLNPLQPDFRSDIFALGSIFYELLTQQKLFQRPTAEETVNAILQGMVPSLPEQIAMRHELQSMLQKSLAIGREDRFQSHEEFGNTLRRFQSTHFPNFESKNFAGFLFGLFEGKLGRFVEQQDEHPTVVVSSHEVEKIAGKRLSGFTAALLICFSFSFLIMAIVVANWARSEKDSTTKLSSRTEIALRQDTKQQSTQLRGDGGAAEQKRTRNPSPEHQSNASERAKDQKPFAPENSSSDHAAKKRPGESGRRDPSGKMAPQKPPQERGQALQNENPRAGNRSKTPPVEKKRKHAPAPQQRSGKIYLCNGQWTNTPCEGASEVKLPEISRGGSTEYASEKRTGRNEKKSDRLTRLRLYEKLKWSWETKNDNLKLSTASISLRNYGEVEAVGVEVFLVFAKGKPDRVKLSGSPTIPRNSVATYELNRTVGRSEISRLKAIFSCRNCRN